MKIYFIVIIIVLAIVILLLFFLLYKIYILHIKSYEEGYYDEEEEAKHLTPIDEVDSGEALEAVESSQESISSKTGSSIVDETTTSSTVQPNVKSVVGPILSNISPDKWRSEHEKCSITVSFEYIAIESKLRATLLEANHLPKSKSGSSEAYVDMQLTPYKRRTYRPPGYRRPLRGCLKKPVDFNLDPDDVRTHYFLLFLLRYDPFSRLKVDGEALVYFGELEGLLGEELISVTLELRDSEQQFTGFILRQGEGSTRSLNGSSRSHNGSTRSHNGSTKSHNGSTRSPSGLRRSQDDSVRASARSLNGLTRSKTEGSSTLSVDESAKDGLRQDRLRVSTRSTNGLSRLRDDARQQSNRSPERKLRESSRSLSLSPQSPESPQLGGFNRSKDGKLRDSSRSLSSSPQSMESLQMGGLNRSYDGKLRDSSRSFSGFVSPRDRAKLPTSGLAREHYDTTR